jgi:hypothetical protein
MSSPVDTKSSTVPLSAPSVVLVEYLPLFVASVVFPTGSVGINLLATFRPFHPLSLHIIPQANVKVEWPK